MHAGTTQQSQQQGFRLVIPVMGSDHRGAVMPGVRKQGLIAGLAGPGFDALVRIDRYRDHPEWQSQAGNSLLAVSCPVRAVWLQLMIDMHHAQPWPQPSLNQQLQQQGRIQPTTKGKEQRPWRGLFCQIGNQWRRWHRGSHHSHGNRQDQPSGLSAYPASIAVAGRLPYPWARALTR